MTLTRLRNLLREITPTPWKFDCGNGEIESEHAKHLRSVICVRADLSARMQHYRDYGLGTEPLPPYVDADLMAIVAVMNCAEELLACAKIVQDLTGYVHGEDCYYEDWQEDGEPVCECGLLEAEQAIAALNTKMEKL